MSAYLNRIRSLVGSELLLLPAVTVLAFDDAGRVLLARHRESNRWIAPGGMVEPDERPEDAALREMREETGCDVELRGLIGVFGGPKFRVRYANGDEAAYVMSVYRARITRGTPTPDADEISELAFIAPEEFASLNAAEWLVEILQFATRH